MCMILFVRWLPSFLLRVMIRIMHDGSGSGDGSDRATLQSLEDLGGRCLTIRLFGAGTCPQFE